MNRLMDMVTNVNVLSNQPIITRKIGSRGLMKVHELVFSVKQS